jgi:hydroxycarboxylate dehydrogenase B
MPTLMPQPLRDLVRDIFANAGSSPAEAGRIARYLVEANLTGHDSHGVSRVLRYVAWKEDGSIIPDQKPEIVTESPVYAVVDGKFGYGQTVTPFAVRLGIEKCKAMGLSAIGLRNAGHIGRVGDWAEMAAAEGLVSIHFVNVTGSVLVAPYGGTERRISTAPYTIGVPRPPINGEGQPPLLLDFATSIVAEGKVHVASQGGKKIPNDALIGPDGKTSGDPHLLYGDYDPAGARNSSQGTGAIRAFGDHKGSGLAFMCEILGGALTGNTATQHGRKVANGMLSFYVDPKKIDPAGMFPDEMTRYTDYVKSSKPVVPGGEVLVPGEAETRMRAKRNAEGIPLPEDTWTAIVNTAKKVGLGDNRIKSALG